MISCACSSKDVFSLFRYHRKIFLLTNLYTKFQDKMKFSKIFLVVKLFFIIFWFFLRSFKILFKLLKYDDVPHDRINWTITIKRCLILPKHKLTKGITNLKQEWTLHKNVVQDVSIPKTRTVTRRNCVVGHISHTTAYKLMFVWYVQKRRPH